MLDADIVSVPRLSVYWYSYYRRADAREVKLKGTSFMPRRLAMKSEGLCERICP